MHGYACVDMSCSFGSYVMHDFWSRTISLVNSSLHNHYTVRGTCQWQCVIVTHNVQLVQKFPWCFSGHTPDLQSCIGSKRVARLHAIAKHREPCGMPCTSREHSSFIATIASLTLSSLSLYTTCSSPIQPQGWPPCGHPRQPYPRPKPFLSALLRDQRCTNKVYSWATLSQPLERLAGTPNKQTLRQTLLHRRPPQRRYDPPGAAQPRPDPEAAVPANVF